MIQPSNPAKQHSAASKADGTGVAVDANFDGALRSDINKRAFINLPLISKCPEGFDFATLRTGNSILSADPDNLRFISNNKDDESPYEYLASIIRVRRSLTETMVAAMLRDIALANNINIVYVRKRPTLIKEATDATSMAGDRNLHNDMKMYVNCFSNYF